MCGIAGLINYEGSNLNAIKQSLFHRGPDDQSIYIEKNIALIHTRLAIQDIQHGKQPLHFEHCSIIFNGEIYNHRSLRDRLKDYDFQTYADTETLLYLYLKYDEDMFEMIDGMFSFCIYDKHKNQLILAKDRAGKKPLFHSCSGNRFLFASELNALKSMASLSIDDDAIACYLRTGFFYRTYSAYKNVHSLPAGSLMRVDINTLAIEIKKYFDILYYYQQPPAYADIDEVTSCVDELLTKSVRDRLLASDIEVGVFLSGGIDSNLIAAMASKIRPNIKSFTVKTEGAFDESHLAKIGALKYGTQHTELQISVDLEHDIEKILLAYGQPFMDSSAVPSFYVAKAAKEHVSVILNGDGADELFGGYRRYVATANSIFKYLQFFAPIRRFLPKPNLKQSIYSHFYRLLNMAGKKNLDYYLSSTTDLFEDLITFKSSPILNEMNEFISKSNSYSLSKLNRSLYLDFNLLLFSDLLVKIDIATMAHSLEGRSPFLSKYMLEFAPTIRERFKVKGLQSKSILRQLAKSYLPSELINQPKRGFEVPLVKWVNQTLKERVHSLLSGNPYASNFIDKNFIKQLLENKLSLPGEKRAKMLWNLFCLEVWYSNEQRTVRSI